MTAEIAPDEKPKKKRTEKQARASRENGSHSKGPVTEEGKKKSSRNAWKHGLCAKIVDVPGEDQEVFGRRHEDWNRELNPHKGSAESYLVTMLVRHSINLDRCHSVNDARVAQLARDAINVRNEQVMREVEDLTLHLYPEQQYKEIKRGKGVESDWKKTGPPPQPGHTVRRLKISSEGCERLIAEWEFLRPALIVPPHWDADDAGRALALLGASSSYRTEVCDPLALPLMAIREHREVAAKLEKNLAPGGVPWTEKYSSDQAHQRDKDRINDLATRGESARLDMVALIDEQQSILRECAAALRLHEGRERSEATYRARFDASDEGRLMHRYQSDQQRGFIRTFELLKKLGKESMQKVKEMEVASSSSEESVAQADAPACPNEPGGAADSNPDRGPEAAGSERKATPSGRKKGRGRRRNQ